MFRAVVVIAGLAVTAWCGATAEPSRKWTVGSWEVTQQDGYCVGSSPSLRSGKTSLIFSIGGNGMLAALLANPTWQMKGSRINEVAVSIDAGKPEGYPTKVVDPTAVAVALPNDLVAGLQDGAHVTFEFERVKYTFPLNYTRTGLAALQQCYEGATETASTEHPSGRSTSKRAQPSSGSGMFVSRDGAVLTNAHVVDGCAVLTVSDSKGAAKIATVTARDATNDLALLRTGFAPTNVATFRAGGARLGEGVAAFGFPLASVLATSGNFTLGNVTATAGLRDDSRYIQISTPIQPGNSGGPLFDATGNVVGVVTAKLDALKIMLATNGDIPQNVNFAIKGAMAVSFLESGKVAFEVGKGGPIVEPTDLASRAGEISVFVRCDG